MSTPTQLAKLFTTMALLLGPTLHAQTPEPPAAPLPTALTTARKVFLGNAGDQENADCLRTYNVFYAGVQNLHRFDLVGDPKDADLVLELHYEFGLGAGVNGGTNTPRQFRVIVEDPKTRIILWSLTERSNYAVFQKNRDKNLDETINVLVKDFDTLTSATPPRNHSVAHH